MSRSWRYITLSIVSLISVLAATFATYGQTRAAVARFEGEWEDHFWKFEAVQACRDGFKLHAREYSHPDINGNPGGRGDNLAYSLQLTGANAPLAVSLPARIAGSSGGRNHELAEGERTYRFATPQRVGTVVTLFIERWDHGLNSADETGHAEVATNDGSTFDDISGQESVEAMTVLVQSCSVR